MIWNRTGDVVTLSGTSNGATVTATYDPATTPPWTITMDYLFAEDEDAASIAALLAAQWPQE